MKNSGTCLKCHCSAILEIDGHAGAYGSGNNIPVGMTIFSSLKVLRYVCTNCGYSEEWISTSDLSKLAKRYSSV